MKHRRKGRVAAWLLSAALLMNGTVPGTPFVDRVQAEENTVTIIPAEEESEDSTREGTGRMEIKLKIRDKITPTVSLEGWTKGETPKTPVVDGNTGGGAVTYTYQVNKSGDYTDAVPTTAGTHSVKATIAETEDYLGGEATADFEIAPVDTTSQMTITLDIHRHSFTYAADGATITATCGENAGTCDLTDKKVSLTLKAPAKTKDIDNNSAEATFDREELAAFNQATKLNVSTQNITYVGRGDTTYAESSTAPTEAGTYTAKVTVGAGTDAVPAAGSTATATVDYTIASSTTTTGMTITLVIKEKATVTAPQAIEGLSYTGQAQALVTAGSATGGTMQYKLGENGTYSATIPAETAAGEYKVYYKAVGDADHRDSDEGGPITVTIAKAANPVTVSIEGWTYGDTAKTPVVEATYGKNTAVCTYSTGADGTYVSEKPVNAGTYYVKAAIAESDNYNAAESVPFSFTIAPKALTDAMLTLDAVSYEHDGNEKTPTITVKDGNTVLVKDTDYTIDPTSTTGTAAYGTYTVKVNGKGNYTGSAVKGWEITDHAAPELDIRITDNTIRTALNAITFGLFFKQTQTVTITAADAGSGVDKVYYFTSATAVSTVDELKELAGTNWTEDDSFSKDPEAKFIVYAKATDKAGNEAYAASNGIILDGTKPVITVDGANAQTEYHKAVNWSASDDYLKNVKITFTAEGTATAGERYNEDAAAEQTTLAGTDSLAELGSYTIKATDKAGNETEVTFAITGRDAVITGGADSITYEAGTTYDLSQLFTVEDGVAVSSYEIVANADTSVEAGAGTITGAALTVTRAGLITIKATVAKGTTATATPEFIKETTAQGTLTVGKADGMAGITIADVVYGNAPAALVSSDTNAAASTKILYTMTADAEGREIPAAEQTASETKPTAVGTYKAAVTYGTTGLYKTVSAETTFKITPAVLTVTAEAKEKTYGDADPALTYSVEGLVYEDKAEDVLTGALSRAEGENAGTYAIAQGTLAANSSYTIDYTGADFTIRKAAMADKTVADTIVVISAGVKDETIDLTEYLESGAKLKKAETTGDLGEYITSGALADGTFTYSVAENAGGIKGSIVLTVSSTNYQDYTITINLASAKRITEVVVESEDVKETAVKTVEVPALEDFTEAQPEAAVEVKMEVKLESEETVGKEVGTAALAKIKDAIAKAFGGVAGSDLAQEYLDITITKSVNGGAAQEISDMNRVMEIAVSYDLTGKYNPVVIREHGGSVRQFTKLSSRSAAGNYKDGTFYVESSGTNSKIYIYARYFSVYTIAYTTASSYQVTYDDATADASKDIQSNVDQVIVATGAKAVKPADPKRDGYDFDGWYIEGTKTKWNFDNAVTGDIRLVAHWDDDDDEKDDTAAAAATPAAPAAQPRSPKTDDGLPGYAFWLILAAAGAGVCLVSAKTRKKERE